MGSIFRRLRTGAKTCMHQYVEKPMLSKWRGVKLQRLVEAGAATYRRGLRFGRHSGGAAAHKL